MSAASLRRPHAFQTKQFERICAYIMATFCDVFLFVLYFRKVFSPVRAHIFFLRSRSFHPFFSDWSTVGILIFLSFNQRRLAFMHIFLLRKTTTNILVVNYATKKSSAKTSKLMTDFGSYFRLIQSILRKCLLTTASKNGQTVLLTLFLVFQVKVF